MQQQEGQSAIFVTSILGNFTNLKLSKFQTKKAKFYIKSYTYFCRFPRASGTSFIGDKWHSHLIIGKMFIEFIVVEIEEENLSLCGQHIWRSHHFTCCSVTKAINHLLRKFHLSAGDIICADTTLNELNCSDRHFSTTFSVGFKMTFSSWLSLTWKSNIKISRVCYWTSWLWGRYESYFVHRRSHGIFVQRPFI